MIYQLDPDLMLFPDPVEAEPDGVIAVGGDLSVPRLLEAYCSGIFPWFEDAEVGPVWFSPDPRMVLRVKDFAPHKSLRRVCRSGRYEVRVDTSFDQVMRLCASTPRNYEPSGTWINDHFLAAYNDLHLQGHAHSFETFHQGQLVGGLYGVSIGDWFFGESMFHTMTDASKVAFCAMVDYCRMHGLRYVDCQMETTHLHSLGARPMPRQEYLDLIYSMPQERSLVGTWASHSAALLLGSNQGDRELMLQVATAFIDQEIGPVSLLSSLHETEPWGDFGPERPQPFLNQALVVDTELTPHQVLQSALGIEEMLGRDRTPGLDHYSSRPIDIDLIFYDRQTLSTPALTLPHPRMHQRQFVLDPLSELIPDYRHPLLHLSVEELRQRLQQS